MSTTTAASNTPLAPTIAAGCFEGLSAMTADGRPARFALLDEDGNVVAEGQQVAKAAYAMSVEAYRRFLMDKSHLRVYTKAEALAMQR